MILHAAQVIEPHIGGDLKFQNGAALLQRPYQRFAFRAAQIRRIQSVADSHRRHFLSRCERFSDTLYASGDVVAQSVVLARVDPDHKPRILVCDAHQLMDHGRNIPDIV